MDLIRLCDVLGVEPGASIAEVKAAYRDLVQVWHPDRFGEATRLNALATRKLQEINKAYGQLIELAVPSGYVPLPPPPSQHPEPKPTPPEPPTASPYPPKQPAPRYTPPNPSPSRVERRVPVEGYAVQRGRLTGANTDRGQNQKTIAVPIFLLIALILAVLYMVFLFYGSLVPTPDPQFPPQQSQDNPT